jgi:ABC-type transport system involved in multi-copper enzyme maturation permease subunit
MMRISFPLAEASFKGGIRDRLLVGLFVVSLLLFLSMPLFSSFSMRDVTGVAMTYSLSVISAIGVILAIFLGGALISRDIQSRTIYSIATLPISRSRYLVEKFLGLVQLLFCSMAIVGFINFIGLAFMAQYFPPDKAISWANYFIHLIFDFEKLLILSAVLVLFSTVATSSFLPMVLTLAVYAVGSTTDKVKLYVETVKDADKISPIIKLVVKFAYYLFPNLALFDLKLQAIYSLPLEPKILLASFLYGAGYIVVTLVIAAALFIKRDFV